jgi:hypothetical protein
VTAEIRGRLPDGKTHAHTATTEAIVWQGGRTTLTLEDLYAEIEQVIISGLPDDGEVSLRIIDHMLEDHTLLTPMWAEIPTGEQVEKLLQRKLNNSKVYHRKFGLPACPKSASKTRDSLCEYIWLPWNVMVGEGLLAYGYRSEAADLVSRIMPAIIKNLKHEHAFRSHYHADEPGAAGQRNSLIGLPPVGLFIETLGVRLISPWKVEILDKNPFPWPVSVKYRGLHILSTNEDVIVTFPDGEEVVVSTQIPCTLEHVATVKEDK